MEYMQIRLYLHSTGIINQILGWHIYVADMVKYAYPMRWKIRSVKNEVQSDRFNSNLLQI